MNIAIDIRLAQPEPSSQRGFGRFSRHFTSKILEFYDSRIFLIRYTDPKTRLSEKKNVVEINIFKWLTPRYIFQIFLLLNCFYIYSYVEEMILHFFMRKHKIDVLLTFSSGNDLYKFRKRRKYKIFKVFYDAIPIIFENEYLQDKKNRRKYVRYLQSFTSADRVITISEHSKQDFLKYVDFPEGKVKVVYPGVSDNFKPIKDGSVTDGLKKRYSIKDKYLLYVGGFDFRKNVPRIFESYSLLPDDLKNAHNLVICGGIDNKERAVFNELVATLHIEKNVIFTGFVPDAELPVFFSGAEVFVFPSLYEGFGLPVLEAMSCGCPVITANNSSLGEICSDAAYYVDPNDTRELADSMKLILSDERMKRDLSDKGLRRAKKFSWDDSARNMIHYFETET